MNCCGQMLAAAESITGCECAEPGFCVRHQCNKPAHFHNLCRNRPDYFEQYEKGIGPGQQTAGNRPPFSFGIGDAVESIALKAARGDQERLIAIGIKLDRFLEFASRGRFKAANDGTCNCQLRKAWLNRFRLWPLWSRHQ